MIMLRGFMSLINLFLYCSIPFVSCQLERSIFPYRIEKEHKNGTCQVAGKDGIPTWLKGIFLRQTCGAFGNTREPNISPPIRLMHFFDCMPMASSYRFNNPNHVTFSNRYYRTHNYKVWEQSNFKFEDSSIAWMTFFSPFNYGKYNQWKDNFTERDGYYAGSASVEFWKLGEDHYEAVDESPHGLHLDINSLESLGPFPFRDNFEEQYKSRGVNRQGLINNPAHAGYDPDGKVWSIVGHWKFTNMGQGRGEASYLVYSISNLTRKLEGKYKIGEFDLPACGGKGSTTYPYREDMLGMLHSFSMTTNYILIPVSSYGLNYCGMLVGKTHEEILRAGSMNGLFYRYVTTFLGDKPGIILVFDKRLGRVVRKLPLDRGGFFVSHQLNAYEKDGEIVADMVTYTNAVYEVLTVDKMISGYDDKDSRIESKVERFTINTKTWKLGRRMLFIGHYRNLDFPQINHDYMQRPYRYVYMLDNGYSPSNKIIKFDVETGEELAQWVPERSVYPGEPFFVPKPGAEEEDDGIVLVGLTDANLLKGSVEVLDGKSLGELARVTSPELTPLGLHNWFYFDSTGDMGGTGRRSSVETSLILISSLLTFLITHQTRL